MVTLPGVQGGFITKAVHWLLLGTWENLTSDLLERTSGSESRAGPLT